MYMPHSAASKTSQTDHSSFAEDVEYYLSLTPRQLPSRYLYDGLGSALFEAICHLPWYGIARTEQHLLSLHARDILARVGALATLIELGPGSGKKLAGLVDATGLDRALTVHLVDVSSSALETAAFTLENRRPARELTVVAHQATYEAGLSEIGPDGQAAGRTLVLFLGSNIGNFDPPGADEFLREIRAALSPGDFLLLGTDLVKPERVLQLAYDDPLGVTAAFNRNLLVQINRELGGDFDLESFAHRALWKATESRVEMHLVSLRRQVVRVKAAGLELTLEADESIWTESSYKYHEATVALVVERAGFEPVLRWIDAEDRFDLTLARAV